MFNWFKSKVELKNEKCIMSSTDHKRGLKIGSEIIVPNNFECLIYNKSKLFNTLTAGKHALESVTFEKLIKHQQKNKSKLRRLKFVAHFVSLSAQQIEFRHKRSKYIVSFTITKSVDFAELMLLYAYKVDNAYVSSYLAEIFEELLIDSGCNESKIDGDALKDYGISIQSFKSSNPKTSVLSTPILKNDDSQSNKNPAIEHQSSSSTVSQKAVVELSPAVQESDKQVEQNSARTTTKPSGPPPCPKCGNVCKFKTTYCLKCGHKLE